MPRYFRQDLQDEASFSEPPTEPLEGLQPLRRSRWEAPMRAQDRVPAVSRRILMQIPMGQRRNPGWRFTSGAPSAANPVAYGVGRAQLTSGHVLRASILYIPSGGVGGDIVTPDEARGTISLDITWTAEDATTETDTIEIDLPASTNDNFEALTGAGEGFGELLARRVTIIPPVDFTDAAEANRWTASPTVEIDAFQIGGSRVVDFVLYEVPYQATYESDDTTWASHLFALEDLDSPSQAASNRPRTRRSETSPDGNPRGGTRLTMDVAREQRERFGPCLLTWGNYTEDAATATVGLQALQRVGSGANLVNLFDASLTAYDATREGLSVSCGGYARPYRDNNGQILGTEDAAAAIPVVFRVYGDATAAVRVRLMTSESSWVEVEMSTTTQWYEGWGYLHVGINPSEQTVAQVFVDGAQTVDVLGFELQLLRP